MKIILKIHSPSRKVGLQLGVLKKKIKKIMNQCIAKKWIERSPFIGFRMSVNEMHKTFLNEQELLLIAENRLQSKIDNFAWGFVK